MNIENRNELCKIDGISVQEIADDLAHLALFTQKNQ
jgi:hypothetical protein